MFAWDRRLNLQTPYSQPKFPPCCWWFGYKKRCLDLHIQSPIVWPSFNNPISLMVTWRSLDLPIWFARKPKGPLKYWLSEILAQICSLSPISFIISINPGTSGESKERREGHLLSFKSASSPLRDGWPFLLDAHSEQRTRLHWVMDQSPLYAGRNLKLRATLFFIKYKKVKNIGLTLFIKLQNLIYILYILMYTENSDTAGQSEKKVLFFFLQNANIALGVPLGNIIFRRGVGDRKRSAGSLH